jgi:cytochrome c-type biogenesis protein CcsB
MKRLAVLVCLLFTLMTSAAARGGGVDVPEALRTVPVEHEGRVKPFDTAAREVVAAITARERFEGADPLRLVLELASDPDAARSRPLVYVPHLQVRERLGLGADRKWATADAVRRSVPFQTFLADVRARQRAGEPLRPVEEDALEVGNRVALVESLPGLIASPAWGDVLSAYRDGDAARLNAAVTVMGAQQEAAVGANPSKLRREVAYNRVQPFHWIGVAYGAALIAALAAEATRRRAIYRLAVGLFVLAVVLNGGAFAWRCSITGFAPVTSIYETVIWVAMVTAALALVLERGARTGVALVAGAVVALAGSVVAAVMPPEYGRQIDPLTPILRSNLWLTTHVLTIVSSYAAFALATVLGSVVLGQLAWAGRGTVEAGDGGTASVDGRADRNLLLTYRSVQVGVVLAAVGTVLGGLWADVSWGRFWGWDPKETWALIVVLVYLALLHARYTNWLTDASFAAGTVVAFLSVVMSWYGVNFVLGTGLHSYGFGQGGGGYVAGYVAAQIAYVIAALWAIGVRRRARAVPGIESTGDALRTSTPISREG